MVQQINPFTENARDIEAEAMRLTVMLSNNEEFDTLVRESVDDWNKIVERSEKIIEELGSADAAFTTELHGDEVRVVLSDQLLEVLHGFDPLTFD